MTSSQSQFISLYSNFTSLFFLLRTDNNFNIIMSILYFFGIFSKPLGYDCALLFWFLFVTFFNVVFTDPQSNKHTKQKGLTNWQKRWQ